MTRGELEFAKRKALEVFDKWVEVTGVVSKCDSYYYELCSVIEDAVDIGARVACDDTDIQVEDYWNDDGEQRKSAVTQDTPTADK